MLAALAPWESMPCWFGWQHIVPRLLVVPVPQTTKCSLYIPHAYLACLLEEYTVPPVGCMPPHGKGTCC